MVQGYADIIADELNVKAVSVLQDAADVVSYTLNPLPDELGPRFKGEFPKVQKMLREWESDDLALALLDGQDVTIEVDGQEETLTPDEVEVQVVPAEGYAIAEDYNLLAALDVRLTDDLLAEGLAREFIRRVQTLRRDADFAVDDRVTVAYQASERLAAAIEQFADEIKGETLADELSAVEAPSGDVTGEDAFDGETLVTAVTRQ
jgi:isoleucyl-tRNA synthetase